jgi:hypothetical protein
MSTWTDADRYAGTDVRYGYGYSTDLSGNIHLEGSRRGYHVSTVILPWYKPSAGGRIALAWFARMNPDQAVVWHHYPGYSWWEPAAAAERRDRLMKRVAKRTRGLRVTMRALASSMGVSYGALHRTIAQLEKAGAVLVTRTRGRLGRTVIKVVPRNDPAAGGLGSNHPSLGSTSMGGSFPALRDWRDLEDGEIYVPDPSCAVPRAVREEVPDEEQYKLHAGTWWDRIRADVMRLREEINRETPW